MPTTGNILLAHIYIYIYEGERQTKTETTTDRENVVLNKFYTFF